VLEVELCELLEDNEETIELDELLNTVELTCTDDVEEDNDALEKEELLSELELSDPDEFEFELYIEVNADFAVADLILFAGLAPNRIITPINISTPSIAKPNRISAIGGNFLIFSIIPIFFTSFLISGSTFVALSFKSLALFSGILVN